MNEVATARPAHLLDTIRTIGANVGDIFNNDEFTHRVAEAELPSEAGFTFFNFSNGYVTFMFPRQNPADWYVEKGWISPEKEKIARTIACKYGLFLNEPFDDLSILHPEAVPAILHHHLEFANRRQTIIIVHPRFLKICLYGKSPESTSGRDDLIPLCFGHDLLKDISRLYDCRTAPIIAKDELPLRKAA